MEFAFIKSACFHCEKQLIGVAKKFQCLICFEKRIWWWSCFYSFRSTFNFYFYDTCEWLKGRWVIQSMIPTNGWKVAKLSNNVLHNKHETSVLLTNFIKNGDGKKFVSYFNFALYSELQCKTLLLMVSIINLFSWIFSKCCFVPARDELLHYSFWPTETYLILPNTYHVDSLP